MMILRYIQSQIESRLGDRKVAIIYGPRQAGKTTLVKKIITQYSGKSLYITADLPRQSERLRTRDEREYSKRLTDISLLVIDEAQIIPDIGLILKNLYDLFPNLSIIATGSSSFELAQHIQEPLTGRKRVYHLMPLGIHELYTKNTFGEYEQELPSILLYGLYPEIMTLRTHEAKKERIYELIDANLFKDILLFEGIKRSDTIVKLAKMLAYQIGKPVSLSELSNKLGISIPTVNKYITILEQAFIVFRLGSYSKNLRKELSKSQKIYFWDIGIRNGLIDMFQPLESRGDKGEIRENVVVAEVMKKKLHTKQFGSYYFRSTTDHQEIDLIYANDGELTAYEIKYQDIKAKIPAIFFTSYPHATGHIVTTDNVLEYL